MIELASIICLGIAAQWIAWRIKVPAILPLMLIGLAVGPFSTLFTHDHAKLLQPIYNVETGKGLFPGQYLFYFVSLAIGIILFEGGLTLKRREIRDVAPAVIRLITVGSLITFVGGGLAAYFIMGLSWPISFLFSALIIVTGPTVIAPILQNTPLNKPVATVLKWEGILIDPIGAMVAVIVFEFIRSSEGGVAFTSHALISFFQVIMVGLATGALAAFSLYFLIKNEWIPHYLLNVVVLATVLGVFVFSNIIAHESGLLTVVVMGTVMGNLNVAQLKEILSFKESLSILLISILFILLSAHMDMDDLYLLFKDWKAIGLFAFVVFILRPAGVFASARNAGLSFREKLFVSWVGPRGIVAAGVASLFGLTLTQMNVPGAEYITPLVFLIVLGTVLLNATTARLVARLLGVSQQESSGILIIGSNTASRLIAKYLMEQDRQVVLVDNNMASINRAKELGLEAFSSNIYDDDLSDSFDLVNMGYMLAMTSSPEINEYAVQTYQHVFGEMGTFRLITPEELRKPLDELPEQGFLSYYDDFLNLNEVARDYPTVHELVVQSARDMEAIIKQIHTEETAIAPIFCKDGNGKLHPIPAIISTLEALPNPLTLVYIGSDKHIPVMKESAQSTQTAL